MTLHLSELTLFPIIFISSNDCDVIHHIVSHFVLYHIGDIEFFVSDRHDWMGNAFDCICNTMILNNIRSKGSFDKFAEIKIDERMNSSATVLFSDFWFPPVTKFIENRKYFIVARQVKKKCKEEEIWKNK